MLHAYACILHARHSIVLLLSSTRQWKENNIPHAPLSRSCLASLIHFPALGPHRACWFSFHDFIFHGLEDVLTHIEKHACRHTKTYAAKNLILHLLGKVDLLLCVSSYFLGFCSSAELLGKGRNWFCFFKASFLCFFLGHVCNPSQDSVFSINLSSHQLYFVNKFAIPSVTID